MRMDYFDVCVAAIGVYLLALGACMSIATFFSRTGPSGFGASTTAEDLTEGLDLRGRRILITGANSGIGLESVRVLTLRGATVLAAARSVEKAAEIQPSGEGKIIPVACELADPASVRACVATVRAMGEPLDAIIANAGIMALPKPERLFGMEKQFFVNHIGHFILVTGLTDQLAPAGRAVILSSAAHTGAPKEGIRFDDLAAEKSYSSWSAYGQSKLANLLFARELARRLKDSGRTANAVHPGVIATNLGRHMGSLATSALNIVSPLFLKSPGQGAATQVWAAVHPNAASITGEYLADCNVAKSSERGADMALAARLWEESERIVAKLA